MEAGTVAGRRDVRRSGDATERAELLELFYSQERKGSLQFHKNRGGTQTTVHLNLEGTVDEIRRLLLGER